MNVASIRLVHAIPGRVRFKINELKGNTERAEQVHSDLSSIPGIHHAEVNPLTGSVLAFYDPAALESVEFQLAVAGALGVALADVGSDLLAAWDAQYRNGSAIGARPLVSLEHLRTLVPLILAVLGVRSFLFTERVPFPSWYDYFWFAFGTYSILNCERSPKV
jgi:hypothetical protein